MYQKNLRANAVVKYIQDKHKQWVHTGMPFQAGVCHKERRESNTEMGENSPGKARRIFPAQPRKWRAQKVKLNFSYLWLEDGSFACP